MPTPLPGAAAAAAVAAAQAAAAASASVRARHEVELRTSIASTRAAWVEQARGTTPMLGRNPYLAAVPQDILEHPDTDLDMLKGYCQERGITYGERPSLQVLRAKLMASNADVQTVWSLRMTSLAAAALTETPNGQGHLAQSQAAIYHPPSVAPDGPVGIVVAGETPAAAMREGQTLSQGVRSKGTVLSPFTSPRSPVQSQFRRPPAATLPLLEPHARRPSVDLPVMTRVVDAGSPEPTSNAPGGASPSPADEDGSGSRESDQLYLQYCRAKRAEEARDLQAQRNAQHSELKGMLVSLGQSMANVTGVVQAHASSATVAAQRHSDGLVSLSHQQAALRTALDSQDPTLAALRAAKRLKPSGAAATPSRPSTGPAPQSAGQRGDAREAATTTVRRDMLFTATMEAELMEARMASSPLAIQLQRIVRLTHVSPGKPGVFGSYVVYGLYECAGREAAEDPAVDAPSLMVNKEKQRRMKNIIANKADTFVRHLFWLRTVLPEILETPAEEATYEKMEEFTMTKERCTRLLAALKLEAHKAKYPIDHAVLSPAKARMSMLRDLLASLSADHGYESNVDVMLKSPPFAARLSEASRRIGPRYHTKQSVVAHSRLEARDQPAAAVVALTSVVPSPARQ